MRKTTALAAFLAVLVIGSVSVMGFGKNKVTYDKFRWHIYQTEHFTIYYYPEEEEFLKIVGGYAEAAYDHHSAILRHDVKYRIPIVFYETHGEFEQTNITLQLIGEGIGAFAEPFGNRIVLPVDLPSEDLRALIAHELVHVFEYSILFESDLGRILRSRAPMWFMEGLASYLASDEDSMDIMIMRDAVINDLIPPIQRMDYFSFLTYRYGHAACDFVVEEYGEEGLRDLIWEFRKQLSAGTKDALENAFDTTIEEFDASFKRYLKKKYLPAYLEKNVPSDYGRELKYEDHRVHIFSPVTSPSGQLIAALTTRNGMLDAAVFSAKSGKEIRRLTPGFTWKYEYIASEAFDGQRDLSWSPAGDHVAFFAREGRNRKLFIVNALNGRFRKSVKLDIEQTASPSFSPDGRKVAFSGNRNGRVDIFVIDLETKDIINITDDEFFDGSPWWGADGRIYYCRRVSGNRIIYSLDPDNPDERKRHTESSSNAIMPVLAEESDMLLFSSDREGGIYNLFAQDLNTGGIYRYTDLFGGAFSPALLSDDGEGNINVAYCAYHEGRFRLYRADDAEPAKTGTADTAEFESPEPLAYDEEKFISVEDGRKRKYRTDFQIESGGISVGFASDNVILSDTHLIISDILGDHRFVFNVQSIRDYSNTHVMYLNMKHRDNFGVSIRDSRDYYYLQKGVGDFDRRVETRITGASFINHYPFDKFHRLENSIGYYSTSYERPIVFYDAIEDSFQVYYYEIEHDYPFVSAAFVGDNARYMSFGPIHGRRYRFEAVYAPDSGSSVEYSLADFDFNESVDFRPVEEEGGFVNYLADFRSYTKVGRRSLLALRLFGVMSEGNVQSVFYFGGTNTIRGYEFREFAGDRGGFMNVEFRFPLVDQLRFPGNWGFTNIRGVIFWDVGGIYFEGQEYDFWNDDEDRLGDGVSSVGLGLNFFWGPFELHWDFGFPTDLSTMDNDARTTFWIGRKF